MIIDFKDELKLEEDCYRCFGSGKVSGGLCQACEGAGYRITDFGVTILNFVRKNLKLKLGID